MKLDKKLHIDFKTFFLEGRFDFLTLGNTKEWVINNFPDPDGFEEINDIVYRSSIWTYGQIELHFDNDELYMIFSDYIYTLDGGPHLTLDKWFLVDTDQLTLIDVLTYLNQEHIEYSKKNVMVMDDMLKVELASGVGLGFVLPQLDDETDDAFSSRVKATNHNEFEMCHFDYSKNSSISKA